MFKIESDNKVFDKVTRNDKVFVFYKRMDIFGFLSTYVIFKLFEKYEMTTVIELVPVLNDRDMLDRSKEIKNTKGTSYIVLVDVDVSVKFLIRSFAENRKFLIFDNKKSTTSLINNLPKNFSGKVDYYKKPNYNTLKLVFRSITSDPFPNEFSSLSDKINDGELTTDLTNYDIRLSTFFGNNFDDVDLFFADKKHIKAEHYRNSTDHVTAAISAAIKNIHTDSCMFRLNNLKILAINTNINTCNFIFPVVLGNTEIDICVCYVEVDDAYYYKIKTNKVNIDLLKIFKNFKPYGNPNLIWFSSAEKITKKFIKLK